MEGAGIRKHFSIGGISSTAASSYPPCGGASPSGELPEGLRGQHYGILGIVRWPLAAACHFCYTECVTLQLLARES